MGTSMEGKTTDGRSVSQATMPSSWILAHFFCFGLSALIIHSFWDFEDASQALAAYGIYHRYGWNQFLHFFGVPGITWSLLILMVRVPLPCVPSSSVNYGNFMAVCYTLFYLSIDPLAGTLYIPVLYVMYASATQMMAKDLEDAAKTHSTTERPWYGTGRYLKFALGLHFFCWYIQVHLGHKIIEGAMPAIVASSGSEATPGSLGGVLSVAPLFAFYEGLWLVGIHKDLQLSTSALVDEYTRTLCLEHGVTFMRACQTVMLSP